jgi:RecA-family ATPase
MEIRENAFNERLKNVADAMGIDLKTIPDDNLMIWNLRSKGMPLKELAPMIIERCKDYDFDVVIIDPIYKVMYANENDAEEVSEFSSELDHLCEAMDASVIYVHHHSKGVQSSKAANDRMSGSGVFARDPDAIDDIIELELTDDVREKLSAKYKRMIMENFLEKNSEQFRNRPKHLETTQSDIDTAIKYQLDEKQKHELKVLIRQAEENLESATAGQMTCSLREFRSPKPKNMFFVYPIHIFDNEGWLDNAKAKDKAMSDQVKKKKTNMSKFRKTYEEMQDEFKGGLVPIALIAEKIGVSEKTIKRYIDEMPDEFMRLKGSVKKI